MKTRNLILSIVLGCVCVLQLVNVNFKKDWLLDSSFLMRRVHNQISQQGLLAASDWSVFSEEYIPVLLQSLAGFSVLRAAREYPEAVIGGDTIISLERLNQLGFVMIQQSPEFFKGTIDVELTLVLNWLSGGAYQVEVDDTNTVRIVGQESFKLRQPDSTIYMCSNSSSIPEGFYEITDVRIEAIDGTILGPRLPSKESSDRFNYGFRLVSVARDMDGNEHIWTNKIMPGDSTRVEEVPLLMDVMASAVNYGPDYSYADINWSMPQLLVWSRALLVGDVVKNNRIPADNLLPDFAAILHEAKSIPGGDSEIISHFVNRAITEMGNDYAVYAHPYYMSSSLSLSAAFAAGFQEQFFNGLVNVERNAPVARFLGEFWKIENISRDPLTGWMIKARDFNGELHVFAQQDFPGNNITVIPNLMDIMSRDYKDGRHQSNGNRWDGYLWDPSYFGEGAFEVK
ncbi:MAG: hypothetical protein P9L98_03870 [Candidatus Kaelpia imicola]|nr:hypothetical protein [Candidatus Kaelpia imicola]